MSSAEKQYITKTKQQKKLSIAGLNSEMRNVKSEEICVQ